MYWGRIGEVSARIGTLTHVFYNQSPRLQARKLELPICNRLRTISAFRIRRTLVVRNNFADGKEVLMIARPKRLPVTLTEEAQEEPLAVRPRQHPQSGRTKW